MRKLLLFCLLLFIGVFCSACVNSLAVYELNEKAMKLMEDGDTEGAISRWESCIDLDPNVYEARYNLANAYITANECGKALEHAIAAQNISKKEPMAHYMLAVAYDCSANQLLETKTPEGETVKKEFQNKEEELATMKKYVEYLQNASTNYNNYVTSMQNAEDSDAIINKIGEINSLITSTKQNFNLGENEFNN